MKIAFAGWAGSGKTECANYLSANYECEVVSFADGIKFIDKYLFGTGAKNRGRLQQIGEFFRSIDPDVWVNRTIDVVSDGGNYCVDDLRRLNEYHALIDAGFKVVRVVANEEVRVERLIKRDGHCDTTLMYNESENGCATLELIEINNNGTIEDLHNKLDEMIEMGIL